MAPAARRALLAGLIAGLAAAVLANAYRIAYTATTGAAFAEISLATTTFGAIVPGALAGVGYHVAQRWTPRARAVFTLGALAITALSLLPVTLAPLHEGFAGMAAPLHVIVGATLAFAIPRLARPAPRIRSPVGRADASG